MGNLIVSQNSTNSTNEINKLKKELQKINLDIERAQERERKLLIENKELKQFINSDMTNKKPIIDEAKNDVFKKRIDSYVDDWYEKNKENIDIGVIGTFPIIGKIDVLPDSVEKHLYKKMVHVMFAALMDIKLDVMGRQIKLNIE